MNPHSSCRHTRVEKHNFTFWSEVEEALSVYNEGGQQEHDCHGSVQLTQHNENHSTKVF